MIFPGDSNEALRGTSIGEVTTLGKEHGLEVDVSRAVVSEWDSPDEASVLFFERMKASGIEVPS